jgi:hypothetical protein
MGVIKDWGKRDGSARSEALMICGSKFAERCPGNSRVLSLRCQVGGLCCTERVHVYWFSRLASARRQLMLALGWRVS